jgi:hypothetical protein
MTGGGDSDDNGAIEAGEVSVVESNRAHPEEMFRVVLGLGPETSLIRDGLVFNAPTCPESGMKPMNYVWKYYSVLLPRLAATGDRLRADLPLGGPAGATGELTAYGVQGAKTSAELTATMRRDVAVYGRQDRTFFSVMDAEGAIYPDNNTIGWGIDFNDDGDIQ